MVVVDFDKNGVVGEVIVGIYVGGFVVMRFGGFGEERDFVSSMCFVMRSNCWGLGLICGEGGVKIW